MKKVPFILFIIIFLFIITLVGCEEKKQMHWKELKEVKIETNDIYF